jgi:uncharacterized RDD family membrane protein YckC
MSTFDPPNVNTRQDALGSIGRRALAQVLDALIIGVPLFFLTLPFDASITNEELSDSQLLWLTVVWVGASLVYNTVAIALWGMTLGKRIVGLKVVNRSDGGPVSWTYSSVRALVPTVVQLVPVIGPGLAIVVYLRAVFHPLRQGLHDAAAGTIVVKR